MANLVEIIDKERKRRKVTMEDLCKVAGVSRVTYSRATKGDSDLGVNSWFSVLRWMGGVVEGGLVVFKEDRGGGVFRIEYKIQ
jgi:transcriptional regulator with XRE-family HTH domain